MMPSYSEFQSHPEYDQSVTQLRESLQQLIDEYGFKHESALAGVAMPEQETEVTSIWREPNGELWIGYDDGSSHKFSADNKINFRPNMYIDQVKDTVMRVAEHISQADKDELRAQSERMVIDSLDD